ncbi:SHOCT domain-containing protein [Candidatus Allofournierella merdavium]|uniref:SHOCT domain-containing protein n=1 Tax=Candidatus Allofournierella merdavium TaxID=2838593 RepID=UPI00374EFD0E
MVYLLLIILVIAVLLFSSNPVFVAIIIAVGALAFYIETQNTRTQNRKNKVNEKNNLKSTNRQRINEELITLGFDESKEVYLTLDSISSVMKIDVKNERIALCNYYKDELQIIPFQKILECQIVENGATVQSGGIGRAVVGGVLAGGAGAIVGASTRKSKLIVDNLSIRIITSDVNNALIIIPILETVTNRESEKYKKAYKIAQEIHATIVSIIKTVANSSQVVPDTNPLTQIQMLFELKEKGIISDEEFEQKKPIFWPKYN